MSNLEHIAEGPSESLSRLVERIPLSCHIKVHTCFHLTVPKDWSIHKRINDDYHLLFIKGGEGAYTIGSTFVPFEQGKIIFVSSGMIHSSSQNTANPPCIVPIRFGIYDNATGEPIRRETAPYSFSFTSAHKMEYQQLFEKLYHYNLKGSAYGAKICSMVAGELLTRCLLELTERTDAGEYDSRVERVKRIMDNHPHIRYEPDELADMAGLSEKYFRSLFKKRYGETPMEYLLKVRMEYARFLLAESGQSVKQVALSTGYPDPYSFSKQFKLKMGYPPTRLKPMK